MISIEPGAQSHKYSRILEMFKNFQFFWKIQWIFLKNTINSGGIVTSVDRMCVSDWLCLQNDRKRWLIFCDKRRSAPSWLYMFFSILYKNANKLNIKHLNTFISSLFFSKPKWSRCSCRNWKRKWSDPRWIWPSTS